MERLLIRGVEVLFPFPPYDAQVTYMEAVMKALQEGQTALLESPTGTGKTLCLLCTALAWTKYQNFECGRKPDEVLPMKVVYCSRTHSQLSQVIRELQGSPYPDAVVAVLGSREHFCVHSDVMGLPNSSSRLHACQALRAEKRCRYFNAVCRGGFTSSPALDMEDLVLEGRREGYCPYFLERDRATKADIVFMPYNYIIDPTLRRQLPFQVEKNCVVIVDEAHNLPGTLSADGCSTLSALSLANAIQDCSRAMTMLRLVEEPLTTGGEEVGVEAVTEKDVAALKIVLKKLEDKIQGLDLLPSSSSLPVPVVSSTPREMVREGEYMYRFLKEAWITPEVYFGTSEALGMNVIITSSIKLLSKSEKAAGGLTVVQDFFEVVFHRGKVAEGEQDNESLDLNSVRFVAQDKSEDKDSRQSNKGNKSVSSRLIGFWCLESRVMEHLQEAVHALILTSGTLAPLDHFAAECRLRCDLHLRGKHVINSERQLAAAVLLKGPAGETLNGSFAFRSHNEYQQGLGMAIVNLTRKVPGGTLVFFPSYAALYSAVDRWRGSPGGSSSKTIWGLLSETKPVFIEPTENAELTVVVQKFKEAVDRRSSRNTASDGAVLLAVCRGKVSEGVNFSDKHGRCVMVTGIPYANHTDLFIRLKRQYLTSVAPRRTRVCGKLFTGDEWYRHEAMRAVSQCVGRVIRHRTDYGVIVLADERFKEMTSCLPEWIRPSLVICTHFRESYAAVVQFFSNRSDHKRSVSAAVDQEEGVLSLTPSSSHSVQEAHAFMATQLMQEEEEEKNNQQDRQRLRLEEEVVAVKKAYNAPLTKNSSIASLASSVSPPSSVSSFRCLEKEGLFSTSTPLLVSSTAEIVVSNLPNDPLSEIGSTSREFCAFLKRHLSAECYRIFKGLLIDFAALRQQVVPCSDMLPFASWSLPPAERDQFHQLIVRLGTLMSRVDVCATGDLLMEFGRYIPEELRFLYAQEVKSLSVT